MYSDTPHSEAPTWESDVALFIDWEHLKSSLQRRGLKPDLENLIEAASRYGRLVFAQGYADWQGSPHLDPGEQRILSDAGVEPVYVPSRQDPEQPTRRIDHIEVKLSLDCMKSSFMTPQIGTYVLVSGLSHFPYLTQSLRQRGYRVVFIGVSWNRPHRMSDQVDHFIFYDQELSGEDPGTHRPGHGTPQDDLDKVLENLVMLVREQRSQGRYPLLSWLGHQLRRQIPGFNPHAYGFERFKDLVRHAEMLGLIQVVTHGLQDWAMLPGDVVEGDLWGGIPPSSEVDDDSDRPSGPFQGLYVAGTHPVLESENPLVEHREVFKDLVLTAYEIESDIRYEFMTPGFLGQCLWRKGHWDLSALPQGASPASTSLKQLRAGQIRKLVDFSLDIGLLLSTSQFDTDTRKTFTTVHLRRTHPFVQSVLNRQKDSTSGPSGDPPKFSASPDDNTEDDYGADLQEKTG